jgi:hypothetical protein
MAHPYAADASTPSSSDDRIEEFAEFLDRLEEDENEIPAGFEPDGAAVPDESGAAAQDAQGEPGDPAIAAPISWDSDAKALFEQLPPDLQETIAEREAQRERAVQTATTAAAEAKRNALAEANAMFADQQLLYAAHLEQIAAEMAPQRPDPALLAQDPQAFYELQAQYEQEIAQHHMLMRQAAQTQAEAEQRTAITQAHELAQDHEVLGRQLGEEWTDAARRQELLTGLEQIGAELGYSRALMGQANATDILALKAAAEWKAKAEKYDQLQNARAGAVRAARGAPRVAKPGVSPSRAEQSHRGRDAAWARAKAERSGDAYAAVLAGMGIAL